MRVYVIRHGESETNQAKKWTGWLNVHLTDKGKEDAQKAGIFLKNISFDKIYTSDLIRAIETAQNAIPSCRYETSALLREINVGNLANKPLSIVTDAQKSRTRAYGYADYHGETNEQFVRRIHQFQKELETLDCETVAVFTHAGWMRGLLDTVIGTHLLRGVICCNNCTVGIFEYTNGTWRLHSWINLS